MKTVRKSLRLPKEIAKIIEELAAGRAANNLNKPEGD